MALGPGRYDDLCTYVRKKARASVASVIILGGSKGPGFSTQVYGNNVDVRMMLALMPTLLREMADQIEADLKKPDAPGSASGSHGDKSANGLANGS